MSGKRYAILIGNDSYPEDEGLQSLRCPLNDIDGLEKVLNDPNKGQFSEVLVLPNYADNELNIRIFDVLNKANKDDLVLIFYSGHGKQSITGSLYLTAVNTVTTKLSVTALSVDQIRDHISLSSCKNVIIILDCCYSGAAGKAFTKGDVDDRFKLLTSEDTGIFLLTASTGVQTSLEKDGDEYSVFSKHLIEGIKSGDADSDQDGFITIDELFDYIKKEVPGDSPQRPTKYSFDVRGGDCVISKSGKEPRTERFDAIRKLLITYVKEEKITDQIYSEATQILKSGKSDLNEYEILQDELLGQLYKNKIKIPEFISEWVSLGISPTQEQQRKVEVVSDSASSQALRRESRYGLPGADLVLLNRGYVLGYSYLTRQPKWAIEVISNDTRPLEETEWQNYRPDHRIPEMFRADMAEYGISGYTRGFLISSIHIHGGPVAGYEVALLSNATPQHPEINRGIWRRLDLAIRELDSKKSTVETFVISGPIFDLNKATKVIPSFNKDSDGIPIPHAFFKTVLVENIQGKLQLWSFIIPNQDIKKKLEDFRVATLDVERLAGLHLWGNIRETHFVREKKLRRGMWPYKDK